MDVFKSTDFIVGYLTYAFENVVMVQRACQQAKSVNVPYRWFRTTQHMTDVHNQLSEYLKKISVRDFTLEWYYKPMQKIVQFTVIVPYEDDVRVLTIKEIEEKLGYKIKIIGDK